MAVTTLSDCSVEIETSRWSSDDNYTLGELEISRLAVSSDIIATSTITIDIIDCDNNSGLEFAATNPVTDTSGAVSNPWLFDVNTVAATDSKF